ncbi:MAG: lysophospholipase [Candidatus Marinimicrobia bacterium]|nr:lysophospholipase [Candidatus Neomarinimicrobiota bacterium]
MSKSRLTLSVLGLLLISGALWQLKQSHAGLVFETGESTGIPYQIVAPENRGLQKHPLILVSHGLAGSGTIMHGLALTFAHAGYVVATWDFDGHAGNPHPMKEDIYSPWLLDNVEQVFKTVSKNIAVDTSRIAIVGHSMGTAAALTFAQVHPSTQATVAISPVNTAVTTELPRNLLLMAGQLEPDFVSHARARLAEAGGVGGDIQTGTARQFHIIPGVEHISIIFAPATHALALDWLDATFGVQKGAQPYVDRRLLWYGLLVIGTLMLAATLIPRNPPLIQTKKVLLQRRILVMVTSALSATLILWLAGLMGLPLNTLFGIRAGGYLILWFLVAGLTGLGLLKPEILRPARVELVNALLIFAGLWLGIGLVGGGVWIPWLLISKRLVLWPLVFLALLPWCWLMGLLSSYGGVGTRLVWWFGHSLTLFGVLFLAIKITPELGFLMLLLPVFPLVLLFHVVPNMVQRGSWTFALSGALFVSWMLLAVFPLI